MTVAGFILSPLLARTDGLTTSHLPVTQLGKAKMLSVSWDAEAMSESGLAIMYVSGRLESHGTASRNPKRTLTRMGNWRQPPC